MGGPGRPPHNRPGLLGTGRASSSSLPRSPDTLDSSSHPLTGPGTGSGSHLGSNSGQSGQGSLGSHSSHDVNYMNIYQNTIHPHLYDCNLEGSPRHSLGSNNSSNLSTPPSPVREMGSSSYESWIQTWKVKNTKFYVDRRSQHIARASRSLPAGGLFGQKRVKPLSSRDSCHFRKEGGAVPVGLWGFHIQIQFNLTFPS